MKILQISTYYLPNFGGIEQVAHDFSKILKKQGNEVRVVCFNSSKNYVEDEYEGIYIYRIGYFEKIASQAISFAYLNKLKKIIKEFDPDVIHIHLPNPLIVFYLNIINPKCKITVHWHSDIVRQKKLKKLYAPVEKKFLKKVCKIIATSSEYIDYSDVLPDYKEKVIVIPNIVNTSFLDNKDNDKDVIKKIKSNYENKKIIFFIGVHRLYKGIIYLVKAAKYLDSNYQVVIAGSGPLTNELKDTANSLGLMNIDFIGRISDQEKRAYLKAAEIFAFPSITKNEAFGIALAEALYCGTPAVTFTIEGSGVNWVNKNGLTGIEVNELDEKKYAEALLKVSKRKYGKNARQWVVDNFTEDKIYTKVKKFFKDLV